MKLFADDTSIYIELIEPNSASSTLNEDLKEIQNWADQWLITFSTPKTKLLMCSNKKKDYPSITFYDTQIESEDISLRRYISILVRHTPSLNNPHQE